jgi:hypothetical protein
MRTYVEKALSTKTLKIWQKVNTFKVFIGESSSLVWHMVLNRASYAPSVCRLNHQLTEPTSHRRAARPMIAAPAIPIPVFIGAAAPDELAVADAFDVMEAAEAVLL